MGLLNVLNEEFLKRCVVPCDHLKVNLEEAAAVSDAMVLSATDIPTEYTLMVYAGHFGKNHYFIDYRANKEDQFFKVWQVDQGNLKYSENGILTFNVKLAETWVVESRHPPYQRMNVLVDYAIRNMSMEIPKQPNLFKGLLDRPPAEKIEVIS